MPLSAKWFRHSRSLKQVNEAADARPYLFWLASFCWNQRKLLMYLCWECWDVTWCNLMFESVGNTCNSQERHRFILNGTRCLLIAMKHDDESRQENQGHWKSMIIASRHISTFADVGSHWICINNVFLKDFRCFEAKHWPGMQQRTVGEVHRHDGQSQWHAKLYMPWSIHPFSGMIKR